MGKTDRRGDAAERIDWARPDDPPDVRRRATVAITLLAAASVFAAIGAALLDPRAPTSTEWLNVGILGVTGLAGIIAAIVWAPQDDESSPPWDVHTVWLLPAALLTPPAAWSVLLAISVVVSLAKRPHAVALRVVVSCITILTTVAVHVAAQLVDHLLIAGILGTAALWLIGVIIAVAVSHVFITPAGTAIWLDFRWSLVTLGCAFTGIVLTGAIVADPFYGLAGIAPVLLAAFALRWPEIDRNASIDPKTRLPNARAWEDRTRELLSAAELHQRPATVMILDIDRFKHVNDTFGHLAGDQVLRELADVLRTHVHPGDVVGRFGGEEFAITMFELSPDAARRAAERIRLAVAAQRHLFTPSVGAGDLAVDLASIDRTYADLTAVDLTAGDRAAADLTAGGHHSQPRLCTITCTVGLASSSDFGYDVTALLAQADSALAHGKLGGRDQVRDAAEIDILPMAPAAGDEVLIPRQSNPSWWGVATRRHITRRSQRRN